MGWILSHVTFEFGFRGIQREYPATNFQRKEGIIHKSNLFPLRENSMNRNHPKVRLLNQMGMAIIEWFTRGRCLLFQSRTSSFDRTVLSDFLINHLTIPVPTLLPCIFSFGMPSSACVLSGINWKSTVFENSFD